ncbi:MAG: PTS sugar transporter subunit IIA [Deltaproteobacteria bacterium]
MKIADVLKRELVIANLSSKTKPEVIRELSGLVCALGSPNIDANGLVKILMEREKLCSTAVDSGVAIPHGKLAGLGGIIAAFGRSRDGIDFESLDAGSSHLFILLLAPENSASAHLKLLARISRIFKDGGFRRRLMEASSQDEIYRIITEEDANH